MALQMIAHFDTADFDDSVTGLGIEETLPHDAHQRQRHKQKDEGADQNKPRAENGILDDQAEFLPAPPEWRGPRAGWRRPRW